jgi:hypothetical protein
VIEGNGGESVTWDYGCQTDERKAGWHTLLVTSHREGDAVCGSVPVTFNLARGPANVTFENLEAPTSDAHAAISQIIVTNDESFMPED